MNVLYLGFVVHCILFISIFDIYFRSPIVHDIVSVENHIRPLAKRLVLFVADGARADSVFGLTEDGSSAAPYIREVIKSKGRWGVSHTRVPTESRPGHVALVAGFYEDPSAVFKGWKDNPVEFDTVFNRTRLTLGWGSPDILLMFSRGAAKDHVIQGTYPSEEEVFFRDASNQSLWSFYQFSKTLRHAKQNETLKAQLDDDKLIYFIHMLGVDTSGHSHKPSSKEYFENIRVTDKIVQRVEGLMENFYNDNATAYLYTSDHGMTDWGSHGDGSLAETETPFVAWGAGILRPAKTTILADSERALWGLKDIERNDINQVDIPALISTLLGIPIPIHSEGIVPLDILDMPEKEKYEALYLNMRQLYEQYKRKKQLVEQHTLSLFYVPFDNEQLFENLPVKFSDCSYQEQINYTLELIKIVLDGSRYYQNYYQRPLLFCIAASYVGWILWLILNLMEESYTSLHVTASRKHIVFLNVLFGVLLVIIEFLLLAQSLPYSFHLYVCLLLKLWYSVLKKILRYKDEIRVYMASYKNILVIIMYACAVEVMVVVFFERRILGMIMFLFTAYQIVAVVKNYVRNSPPTKLDYAWIVSCAIQSLFPFSPLIGDEPSIVFLILAAFLWTVLYWKSIITIRTDERSIKYLTVLFAFLLHTYVVVSLITFRYQNGGILNIFGQIFSWITLVASPLLPLFSGNVNVLPRLLTVFFALGIANALFSIMRDSLFFPMLVFHLLIWVLREFHRMYANNPSKIWKIQFMRKEDETLDLNEMMINNVPYHYIRNAYFLFFYIIYSFFAMGNIASVNSFNLYSVRCFVSVFSPFTMTALMLVKIVIPFIAVTCTFRTLNIFSKVTAQKIFTIVLIFFALLGLNFLFLVKNVGSWLDIGSSISHYVIAQCATLFLVVIYYLSYFLTSYDWFVCYTRPLYF